MKNFKFYFGIFLVIFAGTLYYNTSKEKEERIAKEKAHQAKIKKSEEAYARYMAKDELEKKQMEYRNAHEDSILSVRGKDFTIGAIKFGMTKAQYKTALAETKKLFMKRYSIDINEDYPVFVNGKLTGFELKRVIVRDLAEVTGQKEASYDMGNTYTLLEDLKAIYLIPDHGKRSTWTFKSRSIEVFEGDKKEKVYDGWRYLKVFYISFDQR